MGIGSGASTFNTPPRKELVAILIVATLLLGSAVSAGLALTRDVFSASAFVSQYLRAVEQRDVTTALSMPGVLPDGVTREEFVSSPENVLLTAAAMDPPSRFTIVGEDQVGGLRFVTARTSTEPSLDIVFSVTPTGSIAGLFPQWRFSASPLGSLEVRTTHATFFSVNGFGPIDIAAVNGSVSPQDFEAVGRFAVFTPGSFALEIVSSALTSTPVVVSLSEPGSTSITSLEALPTPAFVTRVQNEVDEFFEACVRQRVLLPAGCPFGIAIENRVSGEPSWGIARYPKVELRPGASGWEIVPASLEVTFDADIQSLFDGSVTPVHEDIPLTITGSVVLTASGDISVLINRID